MAAHSFRLFIAVSELFFYVGRDHDDDDDYLVDDFMLSECVKECTRKNSHMDSCVEFVTEFRKENVMR